MADHRHMDDLAVTAPVSPMPADLGVLADEWGCSAPPTPATQGSGAGAAGWLGLLWCGDFGMARLVCRGCAREPGAAASAAALAAQRSMRVPTTLSHYSELARLGLPLYRANLDHVHLALTTGDGWPRSRGSCVCTRCPRAF